MCAVSRVVVACVLAVIASACSTARSAPQIILRTDTPAAVIDVTGLTRHQLQSLTSATLTTEQWQRLLKVTVKLSGDAADLPAVAGSYGVEGTALRFTPMFPLDAGREYVVVFDPSHLPGTTAGERPSVLTAVVSRPGEDRVPSTTVAAVYPTSDEIPENQLRMYIQFSAPMSHRSGLDYIRLLDDRGQSVVDPFLPLDAEFWNGDHTRFTVFFDPGRVKRGILPNQQMGRALEPGRRYTLVVSQEWRDAQGQPLKAAFSREFLVRAPDERPLDTATWRIDPPAAGSSSPLTVTFPEPLDHGLLLRALGVARAGTTVEGEVKIEAGETRWTFTPRDPWQAGEHQLVALSFLEDLAGNRIGRAFEVDDFEHVDKSAEPEKFTIAFTVDR